MAEPSQEIAAPSITRTRYTIDFSEIGMNDVAQVGGKNASRGQLFNVLRPLGVNVLDAFSTTARPIGNCLRLIISNKSRAEFLPTWTTITLQTLPHVSTGRLRFTRGIPICSTNVRSRDYGHPVARPLGRRGRRGRATHETYREPNRRHDRSVGGTTGCDPPRADLILGAVWGWHACGALCSSRVRIVARCASNVAGSSRTPCWATPAVRWALEETQ